MTCGHEALRALPLRPAGCLRHRVPQPRAAHAGSGDVAPARGRARACSSRCWRVSRRRAGRGAAGAARGLFPRAAGRRDLGGRRRAGLRRRAQAHGGSDRQGIGGARRCRLGGSRSGR